MLYKNNSMKSKCIFCGNDASNKNKEHVIPQWLIALTGDPHRNFELNTHWSMIQQKERKYSANAFVFPSCTSCNDEYSELETKVNNIINKILFLTSINNNEIDALLDWFDKVRIGLWLGFRLLDKNPHGIIPRFYISDRVGTADRCILVYSLDKSRGGLNFNATGSPLFYIMPSCFILRIKNIVFINISTQLFLARRLGFPYPTSLIDNYDKVYFDKMNEGREYLLKPIIRFNFPKSDFTFYQTITSSEALEYFNEFYQTEYVKERMNTNLKSDILIESKNNYVWNENINFNNLPNRDEIEALSLFKKINIACLKYQIELYSKHFKFISKNAIDYAHKMDEHKIMLRFQKKYITYFER